MMMKLSYDVINALQGRTLSTAESCTGGGIGAALTAVPGSSAVYVGGIISYIDRVKAELLCVDPDVLKKCGAVSGEVAEAMAISARNTLKSDIAISVTGLAGPGGDNFGNPVGTVFFGYADAQCSFFEHQQLNGDRNAIRMQAIQIALELILRMNK